MIEFLKYKQKLLEARGVKATLVPPDQEREFPIDWGSFARQMSERDESICPYCFLFNRIGSYDERDNDCEGCPMSAADNCCTDGDSTYWAVLTELAQDGEEEGLGLYVRDALYEFAITRAKEQEYKRRNQNAK